MHAHTSERNHRVKCCSQCGSNRSNSSNGHTMTVLISLRKRSTIVVKNNVILFHKKFKYFNDWFHFLVFVATLKSFGGVVAFIGCHITPWVVVSSFHFSFNQNQDHCLKLDYLALSNKQNAMACKPSAFIIRTRYQTQRRNPVFQSVLSFSVGKIIVLFFFIEKWIITSKTS